MLVYTESNLIDFANNMYLTMDFLTKIIIIMTASNNNHNECFSLHMTASLKKFNVKPYGLDKMYIYKDLTENKLYHIIDQFNERKIMPVKFSSILRNKIHLFYNGNGRTSKVLFANNDKIMKLIDETKKYKTINVKLISIVLNAQSLQKIKILKQNAKWMQKLTFILTVLIRLMGILKIYLEEQCQTKYYMIKLLIFLKIQIHFFIKWGVGAVLKVKLC